MSNETPVLIAGAAAPALPVQCSCRSWGRTTSRLRAADTSILPKAHVLNQRTMEIFGDVGVAEKIYAKSTPAESMRYMGIRLQGSAWPGEWPQGLSSGEAGDPSG